jgi:hypothetical protein
VSSDRISIFSPKTQLTANSPEKPYFCIQVCYNDLVSAQRKKTIELDAGHPLKPAAEIGWYEHEE